MGTVYSHIIIISSGLIDVEKTRNLVLSVLEEMWTEDDYYEKDYDPRRYLSQGLTIQDGFITMAGSFKNFWDIDASLFAQQLSIKLGQVIVISYDEHKESLRCNMFLAGVPLIGPLGGGQRLEIAQASLDYASGKQWEDR